MFFVNKLLCDEGRGWLSFIFVKFACVVSFYIILLHAVVAVRLVLAV